MWEPKHDGTSIRGPKSYRAISEKELWETTFYNLTHHSTAIVTDAPGDLSVFVSAAGTQLWFSEALTLLRVAITARDDTVLGRFPLFYWLPAIDKPETKENLGRNRGQRD